MWERLQFDQRFLFLPQNKVEDNVFDLFRVFLQVVHVIVDDLGDGLGPVGKNGKGEDWWYEDRQVHS